MPIEPPAVDVWDRVPEYIVVFMLLVVSDVLRESFSDSQANSEGREAHCSRKECNGFRKATALRHVETASLTSEGGEAREIQRKVSGTW